VYDIATLLHPTSGVASRAVVMELVNGTPLVELIGPAMTREDVERVGIGLIGALTAYHSAGLAHLDIHDGNVMVATDSVKVLDPLYYETAWFRSTATRDKQQARDVRQARDVLLQMVHGGSIPTTAAHVFNQATVRPTLELLRTELERALSAGTVFGVGSAAETVASTTPPDLGTEAKHRELRAAYSTWLVEVRSWLKSTLGVGLKLEASGDPIASHEGQDPDQPRRLDAAKLQVLFLEQNPSRVGKVNDLSAVIGLGGLAKPQTAEQHRVFGRRIIAVTTARLKELDAFQVSIADWLAIGPR
jgi:hypothetical protein